MPTPDPQAVQLRAAHPDWSIWPSDQGHWYAGRRTPHHLANRALRLGLAMTVHAPDLDQLAVRLAAQEACAEHARALWGSLS